MSIAINLIMLPQRILPDKWKAAYEESLQLLQAYDFMDCFPAQRNGLEYLFAGRSRDVENFLETGYRGWRSIGDMRSGEGTEDYIVFGDIQAYRPSEKTADDGRDIFLSVSDKMNQAQEQGGCIDIWGGRTEGEDSHIYLLAVGCLFAARFPEAVMVTGSVSAGQCERAVQWANQYLNTPISVPANGRMNTLLDRLRRSSLSRGEILEAFFNLTIEAKDSKMGGFLKRTFTDKEISSYYKKRLTSYCPNQRGFLSILKEYLEMGFSFDELCKIAIKDIDGPREALEDFLSHILEFRLHIEKKETGDFTQMAVKRADGGKVDSAEEELVKVLGKFLGAENRNVNAFYPLKKIRQDCRKVFDRECDVDSVIESLLERERENSETSSLQAILYDRPDSIFRQKAKKSGEGQQKKYDINAYRELIDFKPGCSIRPELEEDLLKNFRDIYQYAEKEFKTFSVLDKIERENYFISGNHNVLLRENVWNRIFEKVMDDEYIIRIYGLFCVNTEKKEGYLFCRNLFASLEAVDYFWERTVDENEK